jgi:hypothetical protein
MTKLRVMFGRYQEEVLVALGRWEGEGESVWRSWATLIHITRLYAPVPPMIGAAGWTVGASSRAPPGCGGAAAAAAVAVVVSETTKSARAIIARGNAAVQCIAYRY